MADRLGGAGARTAPLGSRKQGQGGRGHDFAVLEGPQTIGLPDVVLVETVHVLTSVYGVPREQVVDALVELVQRRNLEVVGLRKDRVLRALRMCRPSGRVSFADALIWAAAGEVGRVYTFDQRSPSEDLQVLTP
ncbi:MAG: PIN domain-containing protein [Armatimonadota bacterium]|nr:PIN domain-containing protein [Armatimonadota bacterium]MDR7440356.1 PIN domain-containing protein [Armatimonadota bacterium]MDR7563224.1 PIN domain-containing protein [Armatimonadota bacterium]MDR7601328.1 PIN domain-containing protein [Armatimonadota bacterium]